MSERKDNIPAKETKYNGKTFRSRLEAKWAVFFDACGIEWGYEVEGFDLPNGQSYLPDFFIKYVITPWDNQTHQATIPLFLEVKGQMNDESLTKITQFVNFKSVFVVSDIPYKIKNKYELAREIAKINAEDRFKSYFHMFSTSNVDGVLIPAVNRTNRLVLVPTNKLDMPCVDWVKTINAYKIAADFQFEFRKNPEIPAKPKSEENNTPASDNGTDEVESMNEDEQAEVKAKEETHVERLDKVIETCLEKLNGNESYFMGSIIEHMAVCAQCGGTKTIVGNYMFNLAKHYFDKLTKIAEDNERKPYVPSNNP